MPATTASAAAAPAVNALRFSPFIIIDNPAGKRPEVEAGIFFILIGTMNGVHSGWNSLEDCALAVRRLAAQPHEKPVVWRLSEASVMSPFEQAGQNVRTVGKFLHR